MRRKSLFIALLAAVFVSPAMVLAQTGYQPYAPLYNTTGQGYGGGTTGGGPVYNSSNLTQPVPLQQYIAGKNAPSYNFNGSNQVQPFVGFGAQGPAPGTPAYVQMQNQQFQQAYEQQLQQQQEQAAATGAYGAQQGAGWNPTTGNNANLNYGLTGGPFGNQPQQQAPKKRRVLYKQMNDPLKEPARLFDPNQ